jgi:hypothetical protein
VSDDRRSGLLGAKLRALVADRWGDGERALSTFPRGTALADAGQGWVLADERPERVLGPALVWAERAAVTELHVLVERTSGTAGALARRASAFVRPITVWEIDGRATTRAIADPAPPAAVVPAAAANFARTMAEEGLEVVVEDGIVRGELLGLEVARVVDDGVGSWLEVGVGKHDREAQRLVHGDAPPVEALRRAVEFVRQHRRPGAEGHPLNRLSAERWLRALVVAAPGLVGATELAMLPCPVPRDDLRLGAPAPAGGDAIVVACSTGIDLDLVPVAADARLAHQPDARLVLVMPERDDHAVTRSLAAALTHPAEIHTVPDDWRAAL